MDRGEARIAALRKLAAEPKEKNHQEQHGSGDCVTVGLMSQSFVELNVRSALWPTLHDSRIRGGVAKSTAQDERQQTKMTSTVLGLRLGNASEAAERTSEADERPLGHRLWSTTEEKFGCLGAEERHSPAAGLAAVGSAAKSSRLQRGHQSARRAQQRVPAGCR